MNDLEVGIRSMTQAVVTLSGGQRQCVSVARAAAFAQHKVIMDEPTAALGVKESNNVLELIRRVREKGLSVVLGLLEGSLQPGQQAESIERYAFYERVRGVCAIVVTGELQPFGNFILRKGCIGETLRP